MRSKTSGLAETAWPVGVLAVTLFLWEIAVRVFSVRQFILPAPSAMLVELASYPSFFVRNTAYTVMTTLIGFFLAVTLGVLIAIGIVYSRFLERTLYTLLVTLNSVPKVALAPLFVIWLGTDTAPKVAIALLIGIFAIVVDMVLGLRSVDPDAINLARTARASKWQVLWKIRFPSALPSLFAGMKVAISLSLVGAIVGEFVAGNLGLGHVILLAQGQFDTPRVFAAILLLGLVGIILFYVVDLLERWALPWHVSQRVHSGTA
jgi:NitT/TauT family transport system permease protein